MAHETSKLARLLRESVAQEVPQSPRFSDWDGFANVSRRATIDAGVRYFRATVSFSAQYAIDEGLAAVARFDSGEDMKRIVCQRIVGEVFGEFVDKLDLILHSVAENKSRACVMSLLSALRQRMTSV